MTNITTLHPGQHFMFKGFEWVCLDPNHPDGADNVIALIFWPLLVATRIGVACYRIIKRLLK